MKKKTPDEEPVKKAIIEDKNGLNIAYDRNQFENNFPNLISEITDKKKLVKIDSVGVEIEKEGEVMDQSENRCVPKELINPGAIDFLRRCSTKEEAIEILDYLLNKKELTVHEYKEYKKKNSYLTNTALIRDMIREYLKNNKDYKIIISGSTFS